MKEITADSDGRVGILGNPSDIYYGHVISSTISNYHVNATVKVSDIYNDEKNTICGVFNPEFENLIEHTLIYLKKTGHTIQDIHVKLDTNIPKQAGLAGSSAIIITLLKGINSLFDLELDWREIAHYATMIEHEEIGITAGPQDRFIICKGSAQYMDFSSKEYKSYYLEELNLHELPLYIGVRSKNISSGDIHKFPYKFFYKHSFKDTIENEKQLENLHSIIKAISNCAIEGKKAIIDNDLKKIGELMERNQNLTQQYGEFGNPNENVLLQRKIDKELIEYCKSEESILGVKLGGSSGSLIILSEKKPEFLRDFKLSDTLANELKKIDQNYNGKQISDIIELIPGKIREK